MAEDREKIERLRINRYENAPELEGDDEDDSGEEPESRFDRLADDPDYWEQRNQYD